MEHEWVGTGVVSSRGHGTAGFHKHGASAGAFTLGGTGAASQSYTLEAATNLTTPIFWLPVTNTIADTNGGFELLDLKPPTIPAFLSRDRALKNSGVHRLPCNILSTTAGPLSPMISTAMPPVRL